MSEHLPIQRWTKIFTRYPASELLPNESGEYVTYVDHLAALRDCEQRVLKDTVPGEWHEKRMAWVRKDALDAAREAVEVLPEYALRDTCVSAIDSLKEKK